MALVVALVLLVVVTLVGLAAIRGTTMQQQMTSNFYDREIGFQSAEAGLRVADATISTSAAVIARNCGSGGVQCLANPFTDATLPANSIQTVPAGQFDPGALGAGEPQYVIENMGAYPDPNSNTGFNQTANGNQYGVQGASTTAVYYRITARSGDPANVGDRSIVTLQTMVKQ
ncbi:MAG: pilus assembly protein [Halothiobacillus sp. 14-56-357]|nr:MAG: pilus assembly protein [Halothiobacillus sp. 15-55-196]OZB56456.1 MAG: pilus assembly protein [Halothiobacillus sp. 14-56-357]OZB78731.1 MAG: pilus assembly protein [Halothiobacillus sp. 13-55-115]